MGRCDGALAAFRTLANGKDVLQPGHYDSGSVLTIDVMLSDEREFGIEARIFSVDGPAMVGRSHVEVPVHVRDQRTVN